MPVFKITRWETCSATVYIEADSEESAEEAADFVDDWTENQDITYEFQAVPAHSADYNPKEVYKV
jgi:hypothetical protein